MAYSKHYLNMLVTVIVGTMYVALSIIINSIDLSL